jgi:hypothetical protein
MRFCFNSLNLRALGCFAVSTIAVLPMATSAALAAPSQLCGKSVIVSWQEDRIQTTAMSSQPTAMSASAEFSVYVSEVGRPFSRVSMAVTNRRGRTNSGKRDTVQGDGSARSVGFHGNTMNATMPRGNAGAMQVLVTFDGSFQSCSAHVVAGKAGGAGYTRVRSMVTGAEIDMYSIKTSGQSCRVQSGNVFGN